MIQLLFATAAGVCLGAGGLDAQSARVTLQTAAYGPLDAVVTFEQDGRRLVGASSSAAAAQVRAMNVDPEARGWNGEALLRLRLRRQSDGSYAGRAETPEGAAPATLRVENCAISGRIESGPLGGSFTGAAHEGGDAPLRDYASVLAGMDRALPQMLFKPSELETPVYRTFRAGLGEVAARSRDDLDFVLAGDLGWSERTFSHFGLVRRSTAQVVSEVDAAQQPAAEARFEGDIAILRVNTFLGQNAITQINEAMGEIVTRDARALIVDLRGTPGGSLAAKNLIEALIAEPMDMGWFTAAAWWRTHTIAPTPQEVAARPAFDFTDPQAAFQTLMGEGLLRVIARPAATRFAGPTFVLIDAHTESVAELAAAALGSSGRATLVGERTAGELLSADTVPLPEGFALMTPLADYSDARLGRVEGVGVAPNVRTSSAAAMSRALRLARRN